MTRPGRYPQELRERAVRMVFEHQDQHSSQWAAITSIAEKRGAIATWRQGRVTWTWVIERDGERRNITIEMSRTLYEAGDVSDDAAQARGTKGRNYVEAVLDKDDPPRNRRADTTHSLIDTLTDTPYWRCLRSNLVLLASANPGACAVGDTMSPTDSGDTSF